MARLSAVFKIRRCRTAACLAVIFMVSGCGNDWFGADDATPPLPGERVSVLQHARSLEPAAGAENIEIRLPAPEPNQDWPLPGGYAHHAMQHMAVAEMPQQVWKTNIGTGSDARNRLLTGPVVAEGRVFAIDAAGRVTALDEKTGNRLWSVGLTPDYETGNTVLGGGVGYADGRLYATTGFAEVVALQPATGEVLWRTSVTAPMRSGPTVADGHVYVITVDNKGIALSAEDGRILWTHAGVEEVAALLGGAEPAVDQGVVVMPYSSGEVAALRAETGTPLWTDSILAARRTEATGNIADVTARPVIDTNRVFLVGHSGLLVGIDMRTGDRAWELEVGGVRQPWVVGNFLYLITTDNELIAVEASTGRTLWVRQLDIWTDPENAAGRVSWGGPTLASDRLIATGSHGVGVSVSPYTGEVLGRINLPDGISLPPAVANGTLYFLTDKADIVAYR